MTLFPKECPKHIEGCAMETIEMKGKMSMKMPDDFVDMSRDESALCGAGDYVYGEWSRICDNLFTTNYTRTDVSKGFFRNTITTETGVVFKYSGDGKIPDQISYAKTQFNTSHELTLAGKFSVGLAVVGDVGAAGVCIWQIVEACDKS